MSPVLSTAGVLADTGWGGHMDGWGWGGLMMLGWWLLVAGAVVAAFRFGAFGRIPRSERRGAREILDERFARGEIDRDEYRERVEVLEEATLEGGA